MTDLTTSQDDRRRALDALRAVHRRDLDEFKDVLAEAVADGRSPFLFIALVELCADYMPRELLELDGD